MMWLCNASSRLLSIKKIGKGAFYVHFFRDITGKVIVNQPSGVFNWTERERVRMLNERRVEPCGTPAKAQMWVNDKVV